MDSLFSSSGIHSTNKEKNELTKYNELPEFHKETNPLLWWKDRAIGFPNLSKVAREYLAINATSVPSERLFFRCWESSYIKKVIIRYIYCFKNFIFEKKQKYYANISILIFFFIMIKFIIFFYFFFYFFIIIIFIFFFFFFFFF